MTHREQRLATQQAWVEQYTPDLRRILAASLPAGVKLVVVGDGSLAALLIRDEELGTSDGYPSSTMGDGGSGEVSRPTERMALDNCDTELQPMVDYVHRSTEAARRALTHAADHARLAISAAAEANRMATKHAGRQADRHIGSGDCQACDRPCSGARDDRLRSGYCAACYMRWTRLGKATDRAGFERATPAWDQPREQEA